MGIIFEENKNKELFRLYDELFKITDEELQILCKRIIFNLKYFPTEFSKFEEGDLEVFSILYSYKNKVDIDIFIKKNIAEFYLDFYEKDICFRANIFPRNTYDFDFQKVVDTIDLLVETISEGVKL